LVLAESKHLISKLKFSYLGPSHDGINLISRIDLRRAIFFYDVDV
jgi:hypothetical protein